MADMVLCERSTGSGGGDCDDNNGDEDDDDTQFCPRIKDNKLNESIKIWNVRLKLVDNKQNVYEMDILFWFFFFHCSLLTSLPLLVIIINRYTVNTIFGNVMVNFIEWPSFCESEGCSEDAKKAWIAVNVCIIFWWSIKQHEIMFSKTVFFSSLCSSHVYIYQKKRTEKSLCFVNVFKFFSIVSVCLCDVHDELYFQLMGGKYFMTQ